MDARYATRPILNENLDDSVMELLVAKCSSIKTFKVTNHMDIPKKVRGHLVKSFAEILINSPKLEQVNTSAFNTNEARDDGHGNSLLSALAENSSSVPNMTHFSCRKNKIWFE